MSFTACNLCDRGGRGNAVDKCACGWRVTASSHLGCYLGTPIVGDSVRPKKRTRSQERYKRFIEYGEGFDSFLEYLKWDCAPERSWNGGAA